MQGTVRKWNDARGFGFIAPENGADLFVHFTGILGRGHRSLNVGDTVEFSVRENEKGPLAVDVQVVRA